MTYPSFSVSSAVAGVASGLGPINGTGMRFTGSLINCEIERRRPRSGSFRQRSGQHAQIGREMARTNSKDHSQTSNLFPLRYPTAPSATSFPAITRGTALSNSPTQPTSPTAGLIAIGRQPLLGLHVPLIVQTNSIPIGITILVSARSAHYLVGDLHTAFVGLEGRRTFCNGLIAGRPHARCDIFGALL